LSFQSGLAAPVCDYSEDVYRSLREKKSMGGSKRWGEMIREMENSKMMFEEQRGFEPKKK